MKKVSLVFMILALFASVFTSCDKDNASLSQKEILLKYKWKFFAAKINGVSEDIGDNRDDILTFNENGTYTYDPGTIKDDPDETVNTGTWMFSADQKYFIIDGENATITELTESKFIIKFTDGSDYEEDTFIALPK